MKEAQRLVESDTYVKLTAIALDEYKASKSGASSEWEYKSNKDAVNASIEFLSFLNKMVINRIEFVEEESGDDEPVHAEA